MPSQAKNRLYTYADYRLWDDSERMELVKGVPHAMSPATSTKHQLVSAALVRILGNYLFGKPCKLFHAPYDVRLKGMGDDDDTVLQPDIIVVCDQSKLDEHGCNGAPDLVMEILSPSTSGYDKVVKLNLYWQAGVHEYWIVDTADKTIQKYILKDGEYVIRGYAEADSVPVSTLEGCVVDLSQVFTE